MQTRILVTFFLLLAFSAGLAQDGWRAVGKPVALTPPESYFMQPFWSPDGKKIAVAGKNYRGLWVMRADGANLKHLSDERSAGYRFAWSPDSREIVARVIRYSGRRKLYLIKIFNTLNEETRTLREYKSSVLGLPQWSSDGQRIYIFTQQGLEFMDAKISDRSKLTGKPFFYNTKKELVLADWQGKTEKRMQPVAGTYLNAVLAPDGGKVAFQVLGGHLYVVNVDGSGLVDLGTGERPDWSPGSDWLVYMIPTDDGHRFLTSDLFVIKADGSGKKNLTRTDDRLEMNPGWSPEGDSIVFDERESGRIYRLRVESVSR
ncbi:MAG: TolB family protein [bacterium]